MKVTQAVEITHGLGLHLRAAGVFVQTASRFSADVSVSLGAMQANGKSIMSVLALGAGAGSVLQIAAVGDDAQDSVAALVALVQAGFEAD